MRLRQRAGHGAEIGRGVPRTECTFKRRGWDDARHPSRNAGSDLLRLRFVCLCFPLNRLRGTKSGLCLRDTSKRLQLTRFAQGAIMGFFSNITKFWTTTEDDVVAFAADVWHEIPVVEKDIVKIANWVVGEIPQLTSTIATATPMIDAIVGLADPTIAAKMAALNTAMAGLNAFAATVQANKLTADSVVQGYSSLKAATSAAADLASTAAHIVAATPASK